MKVIIPKLSGFCHGVKYAQDEIIKLRESSPNEEIFVYGPLIHNKEFIKFLENKGIFCIENIENLKENSKLVIRTHGISKELENKLKNKYKLLDLTCKKVKHLQKEIENYHNKGYFIIITGKLEHPEVQGLISYAKNYLIIENDIDINKLNNLKDTLIKNNINKILITSQTTYSNILFNKVCDYIKEKYSNEFLIEILNSICKITENKEKQALSLQNNCEITFVIGDKNSSNSKKLFEVLKNNNENTHFIENLNDLLNLNIDLKKYSCAMVVSSASTPDFIEKDIVNYLKKI